ncbi:hypothetical protein JOC78_002274 [Bacillus ectoiniformans]|uniref:hypothetical protein n=1 Tax=Bacillus ectoiniformans TaxID=1494429 RepID=UPI00195DA441|nr:hypothetical protein [Bacillus ectoiniformans]MBM7649321.1 hypothetical protein [Bacillus ectoiniformans]
MTQQKPVRWILLFTACLLLGLGSVAMVNYIVDPLWFHTHKNKWNQIQKPVNEREQKTNRLTFTDESFDTLILGSSRMVYVNQKDFIGHDAFNYAVALGSIDEFIKMIDYAQEMNDQPIDTIVIGLDFFETNVRFTDYPAPIDGFIAALDDPFYKYKKQLSMDTLKLSIENARHSLANERFPDRTYNRDNVASMDQLDPKVIEKKIQAALPSYEKLDYEYDSAYKPTIQAIKDKYPDTRFIALTTPITASRFTTELNHPPVRAGYEQWLRDAVSVFGEVYHFNDVNTVTKNEANYYDTNHFYPKIGRLIAHRVTRHHNPNLPDDFGKKLTKSTVDDYLENTPLGIAE